MAFCNSCGAQLATEHYSAANAAKVAPARSKSSLVIVLLGILGLATIGFVGYRFAKSAKVSQKGDNMKIETPFGTVETSVDPQKVADELGIEIYPGAQVQKAGTASVTLGSLYSVTAICESDDSVDKVCDFYRSKFPGANVASSNQNHCTIIRAEAASRPVSVFSPAAMVPDSPLSRCRKVKAKGRWGLECN